MLTHAGIAQKDIENCLTLDKKKFDIRFWVLVTNWNPLTLWSYEPYFRLCTEDHSLDQKRCFRWLLRILPLSALASRMSLNRHCL